MSKVSTPTGKSAVRNSPAAVSADGLPCTSSGAVCTARESKAMSVWLAKRGLGNPWRRRKV